MAERKGNMLGRCPYCEDQMCVDYFEFLRGGSRGLAEKAQQYFCEDRFTDCARYRAFKAGIERSVLARLAPWSSEGGFRKNS